jgi:hypothetical protein
MIVVFSRYRTNRTELVPVFLTGTSHAVASIQANPVFPVAPAVVPEPITAATTTTTDTVPVTDTTTVQ